jgi:hypothetical protein
MVQQARVRGQVQVTVKTTPAGYQTITITEALAASFFGQITNKEMEARWREEQAANTRAAKQQD